MLYLGLAAVAAAICLIVIAIGQGKGVVAPSGDESDIGSLPRPAIRKAASKDELPSFIRRFGGLARRLTPTSYTRALQRKLDRAGNPRGWQADRVLAFKGFGLVFGVILGIIVGSKQGATLVLMTVLLGAAGFFAPDIWVRNLGERRQAELVTGLPDALDMMTVCVEAGLGFDAALARVATMLDGAIASEFARVLQEMQFGLSRADALRAMATRTDVSEIRVFASALVQSSELGISVGDVLREQANEMRVRRRQRAEEKAQKLPVKILLPLVSCMLPSMFVVALGPAAIAIVKAFHNGFGA